MKERSMLKFLLRIVMLVTVMALAASASQSQVFEAALNGPSEAPPNASPGTGLAFVTLDPVAHTMRVEVTFSGLIGTTTASHIHATTALPGTGTAGVATQTP